MTIIDCIHADDIGLGDRVECRAGVFRPHCSVCVSCKKRKPGKIIELTATVSPLEPVDERWASCRQACFTCRKCEFYSLPCSEKQRRYKAGHLCILHRWPEE